MKCVQCTRDCLHTHRAVLYNGQEFCSKFCVGQYMQNTWVKFGGNSIVEWPKDGIKSVWSDHCWLKVY